MTGPDPASPLAEIRLTSLASHAPDGAQFAADSNMSG
jgi:hypothetical protein